MKAIKVIYWVTTALVGLMMAYSAWSYLTQEAIVQGFRHLGFPDYFRIELAVAKFIGALILLAPFVGRLKEWAYAGFAFTFISAFIAHIASGDPVSNQVAPLVFLLVLLVSYVTYHKQHKAVQTITASQLAI